MICNVLHQMFGRDTRSAQVMSIATCLIWVVVISLHIYKVVNIALPSVITEQPYVLIIMATSAMLFGLLGFAMKGRRHQVFKAFGLLLSALVQVIIANGYVSEYPPFDMMLIVCTAVGLWFLFAVIYIARCEGFDGVKHV